MTFEEVRNRYLLKIGEKTDATSEEESQACDRISEAYWRICKHTLCTWIKPTKATLTAVTATANEHKLITVLGLSREPFGIRKVFWEGVPLYCWSKDRIDQMVAYHDGTSGGTPQAYAAWDAYDSVTHDKIIYLSFYDYVATANSTDCYISYFDRPEQPTTANWTDTYPEFASEYHHLIAELVALEFLRDNADRRYTSTLWQECWLELNKMRDHYIHQLNVGEKMWSQAGQVRSKLHFYGE